MLADGGFFAFFLGLVEWVAATFVAGEGPEVAFSSSEETSVEELGYEDLEVSLSDWMRVAKLGGAEAE